uniref:DNA topoisomerase 2 n=1 Tax=Plectus sambesii TaxID=2011161 RepID=A0A914XMA9_9BILA
MPSVLSDLNESEVFDLDDSGAEDSPVVKKAKKASPKKPAAKKPAAKKANAENNDEADPLNVFESIDHATDGGKKRLSIERIYQKKTQLEHILLRPDTYIGSVEFSDKTPMWVYDEAQDKLIQRDITFVPGLYKIFDEVLVNAADNKQRDKNMSTIKINIDRAKNEISVWNNGKGIPVVHHQVEQVYVPELIFGTLLTSSNYDDTQKKTTGGRNGFGAKLCNIFSTKFTVETSCKEYKKAFKQTWQNNMQKAGEAKVTEAAGDDYTKVTFQPDLAKFHMTELDDDIVGLMSRRAYDIAGTSRGLKVFLNGKRLPVTGFKAYVEQYLKDKTDDNGEPLKFAYEQVSDRWEVAVTVSDKNLQQVSFVNSIATTKGGRHVDYVADMITAKLIDTIQKKIGKNGMKIRPLQIKNHMWIFVNSLIENPSFDSQTKETLTLQAKSFGSKCELSEKFIAQTMKCGIVETILAWVRFKQNEVMDKKCSGKKTSKLKLDKLDDANDAGTKSSASCTLILTEGDSAKSLAVSGLGVIGRDKYGVFPLRGKMLNVREATHKQLMENAETNNLIKILGLQYKRTYDNDDDFKTLRYGKVMVMADQDQDGSHIKGLVINFIHYNWPSLIRRNFVEQFITPIVKATKGKEEIPFYSVPEYLEWKKSTDNWNSYRIKYYKGLGTSTAKEAKEYFSDMMRHRIRFKYAGQNDDNAMELAFSKKKIEERKDWLTRWMNGRKERRERNEAEEVFYNK